MTSKTVLITEPTQGKSPVLAVRSAHLPTTVKNVNRTLTTEATGRLSTLLEGVQAPGTRCECLVDFKGDKVWKGGFWVWLLD